MSVTMIVVGGVHDGRRIPVTVPEFLIGRDAACHLRPSSKEVGPRQCALVVRGEAIFLRDDGGGQGTRLNRRLLTGGELQLQDGDLLQVGPLAFRLAIAPRRPRDETTDLSGLLTTMVEDIERRSTETMAVFKTPQAVASRGVEDSREILCPS